jgi:Cupin domain
MHYYLAYTESFEVSEGTLDLCVGTEDNHLVLGEGESAFVPLNTAHRFWNSGAEPVVFEVEIKPARNFEKALRAQFGLVADGKTNDKAIPKNPPELALIYELSESFIVGMPLFLQKGIFGALAGVARLLGYDPEFSEYTKPEGAAPVGGRAPAPGKGLATLATLAAALALLLWLWRHSRTNRTM